MVKNSPAMQETQVRSSGQDDLLEKKMANQPSMLAWEIAWAEGPGGLVHGVTRVRHDLATTQPQAIYRSNECLDTKSVTFVSY